ncbi:GAF domain-containing protein [Chitinophaga pendula]|nr:histidine kinase [Chitinophaga sp. MD30]UCJ10281.1 GAF domain-containing protein [Chitinophaga pendula]
MVSTMLEVVCRVTGMGFAAIARVTDDRWIACSVRDEIAFGLEAGGELTLETTICNEIRVHQQPVVIDHVEMDPRYNMHHTPLMYGFQSYISVPIVLKNGTFFGTLCAIDPKPAMLQNAKVLGLFHLFTELLAFHLQSLELMDISRDALQTVHQQLAETMDENRQYRHISSHNLQEPLRKIRFFSNLLVNTVEDGDVEKVKLLASKVNAGAQRVSMMIKDISAFSALNDPYMLFEEVSLQRVVADVCAQLAPQLSIVKAHMEVGDLPVIQAIPAHMEQLFYHLIRNALKFARKDIPAEIRISAVAVGQELLPVQGRSAVMAYQEIRLEDNGIGIEGSQLENIFDIFSKLDSDQLLEAGSGIGLAYCRKIVRHHGGTIRAVSTPGEGTIFSIVLPVRRVPVSAVAASF